MNEVMPSFPGKFQGVNITRKGGCQLIQWLLQVWRCCHSEHSERYGRDMTSAEINLRCQHALPKEIISSAPHLTSLVSSRPQVCALHAYRVVVTSRQVRRMQCRAYVPAPTIVALHSDLRFVSWRLCAHRDADTSRSPTVNHLLISFRLLTMTDCCHWHKSSGEP